MNNASFSATVSDFANQAENIPQLDDAAVAALYDLASTIKRGGVTVDPKSAQWIVSTTLECIPHLHDTSKAAYYIVRAMAYIQGLCPDATWSKWQLLNGC